MVKKTILVALAGALCLAFPVAADAPFGSLGGKVGGGNAGGGVIPLHGWALDDDGVAAVDIFVDGIIAGRAHYGRNRPGVTARYPSFPDSRRAGFAFQLDSTRYLNGQHTVTARVLSSSGETTVLNPVSLEFTNHVHNLAPFGRIERPNRSAELYGSCDFEPEEASRRLSVLSGWALDTGIETGDMGVGYVELLIDGAIFANSRTDCFFDPVTGGLTQCHGLRRLDIERLFPYIKDSPLSGFRFVLDVGLLVDIFGYREGRHVLTVRAGDISGQVANIDEIPVTFLCDNRIGNEEAFGFIEPVRPVNPDSGVVRVAGWALDWERVDRVIVYVDGKEIGSALYGIPRPDVNALYPGYPGSQRPGWRLFLDTTELSNGPHHVQAVVVDRLGGSTLLGERTINVHNPSTSASP